jgi:hypothetical protein
MLACLPGVPICLRGVPNYEPDRLDGLGLLGILFNLPARLFANPVDFKLLPNLKLKSYLGFYPLGFAIC